MASASGKPQRIARLAPLVEVLATLDRISTPVSIVSMPVADALGRVLAADLRATSTLPVAPMAVRDGWAVAADLVSDAGPYAPAPLSPPPQQVASGDLLPPGCDAVLPFEAVITGAAGAEAIAAAAPGEGVVASGFDVEPGTRLARLGRRLSAARIAALAAAGLERIMVRVPRIAILATSPNFAGGDGVGALLAKLITAEGGNPLHPPPSSDLSEAIASTDADALITIGGTGEGAADKTVQAVAAAGELIIHGMGIRPGETAGLGAVAGKPVLLLPGRLDAALGAWLLVGRPMLARLARATEAMTGTRAILARKITSGIGLADVVLVERAESGVRPIAAGLWPLHTLARADGWMLVPPESEGYPEGATVEIHPLP